MKKLAFAILMSMAAMSANSQLINSETVNNIYAEAVNGQNSSDFCFNADTQDNRITAMYVYQKSFDRKGHLALTPHLKYAYDYAADGMLNSRTTYRWNDARNEWECTSRYDYILADDVYFAEFSRFNREASRFEQPMSKMVYSLFPDASINRVVSYHRASPSSPYQLVSETSVAPQPWLFAGK